MTFTLKEVLEIIGFLGALALVIFRGGRMVEALKKDMDALAKVFGEHRKESRARDEGIVREVRGVQKQVTRLSERVVRVETIQDVVPDTARHRAYDPRIESPVPAGEPEPEHVVEDEHDEAGAAH